VAGKGGWLRRRAEEVKKALSTTFVQRKLQQGQKNFLVYWGGGGGGKGRPGHGDGGSFRRQKRCGDARVEKCIFSRTKEFPRRKGSAEEEGEKWEEISYLDARTRSGRPTLGGCGTMGVRLSDGKGRSGLPGEAQHTPENFQTVQLCAGART